MRTRNLTRGLPAALAALWAVLAVAGPPVRAETVPAPGAAELILDGVTIVDTRTGALKPAMAIAIRDGRIVRIARAHAIRPGAGATLIAAPGKFVVPGFLDMHAHVVDPPYRAGSLPLMLVNGITGFRQMSGTPELLEMRRQGKPLPATDGPDLLVEPGQILTPANARTPAQAAAEVQRQKAQGADFIKMIFTPPPAFFAALEESKRQGLPMVGHLPPTVNVWDASRGGMRSIEHLGPSEGFFIACSTEEAALREQEKQEAAMPRPPAAPLPDAGPDTAHVNPLLNTSPGTLQRLARELDTYSDAKCRKLAQTFVVNDTWQVPTLIRLRTMEIGDDPAYRNDPRLVHVPTASRRAWEAAGLAFAAKFDPAQKEVFRRLFAHQLALTKLFERTGVKMMAGSDYGGGWVLPGYSLHQEFDLLAEAGLAPLTVLQMTTLNGARFLGREASMGTVEVGKDANLVLLTGNPIASIRNLHRIEAVVHDGRYYSRERLTTIEQEARFE